MWLPEVAYPWYDNIVPLSPLVNLMQYRYYLFFELYYLRLLHVYDNIEKAVQPLPYIFHFGNITLVE